MADVVVEADVVRGRDDEDRGWMWLVIWVRRARRGCVYMDMDIVWLVG